MQVRAALDQRDTLIRHLHTVQTIPTRASIRPCKTSTVTAAITRNEDEILMERLVLALDVRVECPTNHPGSIFPSRCVLRVCMQHVNVRSVGMLAVRIGAMRAVGVVVVPKLTSFFRRSSVLSYRYMVNRLAVLAFRQPHNSFTSNPDDFAIFDIEALGIFGSAIDLGDAARIGFGRCCRDGHHNRSEEHTSELQSRE